MAKPMSSLFTNLESEFETLQKSLSDIDASIRRVTGKDPGRPFDLNGKPARGRLRSVNSDPVRRFNPLKRRNDFADRDEESASSKRSLQSQVVNTSWDAKQRNQVLEEQKKDTKSLSRNKRMFGLILGTLEKFKSEESQRKDSKREEIEKKLDQADEQEREAVNRERKELYQKRKIKRIQLKCLEQKLQIVEVHKEWEKLHQHLGNFIETKAKPSLFYLPKKHNSETQKRLQQTKDKYRIIFAEKRAKIQKELNEIEERFKEECQIDAEGEEEEMEEEIKPEDDAAEKTVAGNDIEMSTEAETNPQRRRPSLSSSPGKNCHREKNGDRTATTTTMSAPEKATNGNLDTKNESMNGKGGEEEEAKSVAVKEGAEEHVFEPMYE